MACTASFTKFGELPKELRLQIWENASFFERIVELKYCIVDRKFSMSSPPPAILYVNQESREIALKFYNKSLGSGNHPAEIFFNPVSDIIYLSLRHDEDEVMVTSSHFLACAESLAHQNRIKTVALGERWWTASLYYAFFQLSGPLGNIRQFRAIYCHFKQVILVKGAPTEGEAVSWDSYSGISLQPAAQDYERAVFVPFAFAGFDPQSVKIDVVIMELP